MSIVTEPPLGTEGFAQTLHLTNATVEISTSVGSVSVWVDATTNQLTAVVRGPWVRVNVSVQSVRPKERFTYRGRCSSPTSAPDSWSRPAGADSVGLSHRNHDEDIALLNQPAALNATLRQQGLGAFVEQLQPADKWRHRHFGLVASADGLVADRACTGCLISGHAPARAAARTAVRTYTLTVTTLAAQTASAAAWEQRAGAEHFAARAVPAAAGRRRAHAASWEAFWGRSHIWVAGAEPQLGALTERYAQTRFVQAIQAGTWVPIKFNGMLFTAQLPPETPTSGPSSRQWGSCNWWQNARRRKSPTSPVAPACHPNLPPPLGPSHLSHLRTPLTRPRPAAQTRLAYGSMLYAADYPQLRTLFEYDTARTAWPCTHTAHAAHTPHTLHTHRTRTAHAPHTHRTVPAGATVHGRYYLQMSELLRVRTAAAFGHAGLYTTETKTLFGAYDPCDYEVGRGNLSFGYEGSRWLRFDFGGDAGLPELCVMLLDWYAHTLDDVHMARYVPLLSNPKP